MESYDDAASRDVLHQTIFQLSRAQFQNDIGQDHSIEIETSSINQSAWLASLLAQSPVDEHRQLAFRFAILLFLHNRSAEDAEMYREYANVIISRLGSFPAKGGLELQDRFESTGENRSVGGTLSAELAIRKEAYRVNPDTVLTDFQRRIWELLQDGHDISISAPTSAGKSYAIREYVKEISSDDGIFRGIYIVPNRALISEVSSDFRKEIPSDVPVRTSGYVDEIDGDEFLLVITPERCLHYLENDSNLDLNILFLDELQKLEDSSRGPLFEYVLKKLTEMHPEAQIICAGPYIDSPADIIEETLYANGKSREIEEVGSKYTPVVHLESNFRINQNENQVAIRFPGSSDVDEYKQLYSLDAGNREEDQVQELVDDFRAEKQTLVYVSSRSKAEDIAKLLSGTVGNWSPDDEIIELIDFISKNVHNEFPLIGPLQNGVAYHHGRLPQIVRNELERLYREEILHTIVCTPTLLSGVNLPAEKLYVTDNHAGATKLSVFQIQNLVGRVGRVGKKPYGSVHYVDDESDTWADEYLGEIPEKEVVPQTSQILYEYSQELRDIVEIEDPRNNIEDLDVDLQIKNGLESTNNILRSRYLQNRDKTEEFLEQKDVPEDIQNELLNSLENLIEPLSIPELIVRRNPTINPVLQDNLYSKVLGEPSDFVIRENSLQSDLFTVMRNLNSVFEFAINYNTNTYPTHEPVLDNTLDAVIYMAGLWLKGSPFSDIIENRYENTNENWNEAIESVINGINTGVRFVFVQHLKLVCDIFMINPELQPTPLMKKLDKYMERGSLDQDVIDLIDLGIDRSVAISLDRTDINELKDIQESDHQFAELQNRYLTDQGFFTESE